MSEIKSKSQPDNLNSEEPLSESEADRIKAIENRLAAGGQILASGIDHGIGQGLVGEEQILSGPSNPNLWPKPEAAPATVSPIPGLKKDAVVGKEPPIRFKQTREPKSHKAKPPKRLFKARGETYEAALRINVSRAILDQVYSGEKTMEMFPISERPDSLINRLKIGDKIIFSEGKSKLKMRVVSVRSFENIQQMMDRVDCSQITPNIPKETFLEQAKLYYSAKKLQIDKLKIGLIEFSADLEKD